eukprot:TRINITY_DN31976_c0_g1_i1.p1 TRINITY_DN31976_c0_g1~~TRINITY_DN31976_c0_g1_i1.p1  ORF type:complete len:227 (-),score=36.73 TRINITY_DN31976_c0_g1_i1:109-789(-)
MSMELRYGQPPPLFLGGYPLTLGVQIVCLAHFLFCLFVISTASSVVDFSVGTLHLSPTVQICVSTWCVIGIAVIVGALIGCRSRQEFPLRAYFYYNVFSLVGLGVALLTAFSKGGPACSSSSDEVQRLGRSLRCHMLSQAALLVVLAVLAVLGFATYEVWHLKEYLAQIEEAEQILQYEDPAVKQLRQGLRLGLAARKDSNRAGYGAAGKDQQLLPSTFGPGAHFA